MPSGTVRFGARLVLSPAASARRSDSAGSGSNGSDAGSSGSASVGGPIISPKIVECQREDTGTDYAVRPGQFYVAIGDIPFEDFAPGDTVRIRHRADPHRENEMIGGGETMERSTLGRGVFGFSGELARDVLFGGNDVRDNDQSSKPHADLGASSLGAFFY